MATGASCTGSPSRAISLADRIPEAELPVRAVAEGLVFRAAAAAQRVVLPGRVLAELHAEELDTALHGVRTVIGDGNARLTIAVAVLDAIDRIAERSGRALLDGGDDLLDACAIRIDPRLLAEPEDRLQAVGADAGVRADVAVVVDRDAPSRIRIAAIPAAVGDLAVLEADRAVAAVAERLILRAAAAAQGHAAHRDAGLTVRAAQIGNRRGSGVVQQVVRPVRQARDLWLLVWRTHCSLRVWRRDSHAAMLRRWRLRIPSKSFPVSGSEIRGSACSNSRMAHFKPFTRNPMRSRDPWTATALS